MRNTLLGLSAVLLASVSAPALAQDEAAGPIAISGSATVVTDYRFRGISQTDKNFAVQAGFSVAHESGLYASVWGSSIDGYVAASSDQEIDLSVGYKTEIGGFTVDGGVLYYFYPGSHLFYDANTDFVEPYLSVAHALGPVTAKVTANYAPKQKALYIGGPGDKADNFYAALDLSGAVPGTPLTLSAHLGHNFTKYSYLASGKRYTDWSLGASYSYKNLTFGVSYVDTNFAKYDLTSYSGKDIAKAGVVGSIGVSF